MASPLAKGLFHRAIGQSAGGTAGLLALDAPISRASAEEAGLRFVTSLGSRSVIDLRSMAAEELVQKADVASMAPIVDGWLLREDPRAVFRNGRQPRIPLLVGSNADDGRRQRPLRVDAYVADSKERFGALFDTYIHLYPGGSAAEATTSQEAFPPDAPNPGAYHGAELYYVFHNLHLYQQQWAAWDRTLADRMSSYWLNFAVSGNPNDGNLTRWPPYAQREQNRTMLFGDRVMPGMSRLTEEKRAFFDLYYNSLLTR